jgi:Fe-S-cluster-containing dehydrogenase component
MRLLYASVVLGQASETEGMSKLPWELKGEPTKISSPVMVVDLRRCIGCHGCSVACKVEHSVPLGEFRMRVRWMEAPSTGRMTFLPVFDAATCDYGSARGEVGLPPACVSACPTAALSFGEEADAPSSARLFEAPADTRPGVLYIGHEAWQEGKLNSGAALHPDDQDIIYEQDYRR